MASTPDDGFLSSDQNINRFLCKQKLNLRYFIQPLKTLPVELTETYFCLLFFVILFLFPLDSFFFLIEIELYLQTKFKKRKEKVIYFGVQEFEKRNCATCHTGGREKPSSCRGGYTLG